MSPASALGRPSSRNGPLPFFWGILLIAGAVIALVKLLTNHIAPQWDMHYYLDMATHGIRGNPDLAAPFAYRFGAPLLVGGVARVLHTDPEFTFRAANVAMCAAFIVCCFYFARLWNASFYAAAFSAVSLALHFFVIKWTIFSGTMVDIWAYPFLLAAFWALVRNRFYLCLAISAAGLLFKEFLLVPIGVQAIALIFRPKKGRSLTRAALPLLVTALVLGVFFIYPRLAIHVARTFQDIDPVNDGSTLRRLLTYPLSRRHDFNIVFAYLAGWLPVLLLLTPERLRLAWRRLAPYRLILFLFMALHFFLVMYGGTNIDIYITYCAPIQIMVLVILFDEGHVRFWEAGLVLVAVFLFNRIGKTVPLPENGMDAYLDFYGGYYMRVNAASFFRMGEVLAYLAGFGLLRLVVHRLSGTTDRIGSETREIPSGVVL